MCDTASVTVSNINGENANAFKIGQRIEIDEQDDDVASGQWVRVFTGVVTALSKGSDASGGSVVMITSKDNGWFLSSSYADPLGWVPANPTKKQEAGYRYKNLRNASFQKLLDFVIEPSWQIPEIRASNDLNRRLKHGRQVIVQNHKPMLGAVLPFIQVESGQKPFDIISTYAAREGVLVNAASDGAIVFFRPNYNQSALYRAVYRLGGGDEVGGNTVIGRPTLSETIDEVYTESQCWSTVVIDQSESGPSEAENPNAGLRHTTFHPPVSPLDFRRPLVFSDPEAINDTLRKNRAIWKFQMGLFQSWQYEVEFDSHSQDGAFFVSDTMITVDDEINGVKGVYYVQRVQRSQTIGNGSRTTMLIRKPGLLNPELTELQIGGGARGPAKVKPPEKAKLSKKLAGYLDKAKVKAARK